jgi:hypothetical protein
MKHAWQKADVCTNFDWKTRWEKDFLEDTGIGSSMVLKCILKK